MKSFGEFLQKKHPHNGNLVEAQQLDESAKRNLRKFLARLKRSFFARYKEPHSKATIKPWGKL